MEKNKAARVLELLNTILDSPESEKMLNSLGIAIYNHNQQSLLSKGIWKKIDDLEDSWFTLLHPDDRERVKLDRQALFRGQHDYSRAIYRILNDDGKWCWISEKNGVLLRNDNDSPWLTIGIGEVLQDVGDKNESDFQKAWEADILISTIEVIMSSLNLDDTVQRILEQAELLIPYDRATIQILHDGFLKVFGSMGFPESESPEGTRFPYPEEGSLSTRAIQERRPWLSDDITRDFPRYQQDLNKKNTSRSMLSVPLIAHGDVIGLLEFSSNQVSFYKKRHLESAQAFASPVAIALENSRMHNETYQLAMTDGLTGIGSRHAFDFNSKYYLERARREGRNLSFAMLDLDWFKKVNDDFGHLMGDKVLQTVCHTCQKKLRITDFIARYGGEEIIILFPDTSVETAEQIVKRICQEVSQLKIEGINRPITLSAGITSFSPAMDTDLNDLIRAADEALYQSKANGRNRITVYQKKRSTNRRRA